MFIQTEDTPNPNAIKFLPGILVAGHGKTYDFQSPEHGRQVPLVAKLFGISGVEQVFLGADYITVCKSEETSWSVLKVHVLSEIMGYFSAHTTLQIHENPSVDFQEKPDSELSALEKEIKELIETRVRPAVANDGGDIVFCKFEDGIVYLKMQGACSNCPSSSATLKAGIENMLKYYIPEVEEVRPVS